MSDLELIQVALAKGANAIVEGVPADGSLALVDATWAAPYIAAGVLTTNKTTKPAPKVDAVAEDKE